MAVALDYRGVTADTTAQTTYTYTSVDIGTASADRIIVVGTGGGWGTGVNHSVQSMTVGGVSAALIVAQIGGTQQPRNPLELWQAAVPTGTTATVVLTYDNAMNNNSIAIWAVSGATSTISATAVSTADPMNASINCPAGGAIIGLGSNHYVTATFTWTNLTERFDQAEYVVNADYWTGASDTFASTQTGLSITCTQTTTGDRNHMVLASLAPSASTATGNFFQLF